MPKDPTLHAENDSAPFTKTSEAAAAARQQGATTNKEHGESLQPPEMPEDDDGARVAAVNPGRANLMTPTRERRAGEHNPELNTDKPDAAKR